MGIYSSKCASKEEVANLRDDVYTLCGIGPHSMNRSKLQEFQRRFDSLEDESDKNKQALASHIHQIEERLLQSELKNAKITKELKSMSSSLLSAERALLRLLHRRQEHYQYDDVYVYDVFGARHKIATLSQFHREIESECELLATDELLHFIKDAHVGGHHRKINLGKTTTDFFTHDTGEDWLLVFGFVKQDERHYIVPFLWIRPRDKTQKNASPNIKHDIRDFLQTKLKTILAAAAESEVKEKIRDAYVGLPLSLIPQ